MDSRGATTVVAKLLAFGIVLVYVGGMTTVLFGGAVPDYRDATGAELGDRVLTTAADRIHGAIPPDGRAVGATRSVDLPPTIRGSSYVVEIDGQSLRLDHPSSSIGGRSRLALPNRVSSVDGSWQSGAETVVSVERADDGLAVRLLEGDP
jgi:hypothetical protein